MEMFTWSSARQNQSVQPLWSEERLSWARDQPHAIEILGLRAATLVSRSVAQNHQALSVANETVWQSIISGWCAVSLSPIRHRSDLTHWFWHHPQPRWGYSTAHKRISTVQSPLHAAPLESCFVSCLTGRNRQLAVAEMCTLRPSCASVLADLEKILVERCSTIALCPSSTEAVDL